jgi:Tfp pilus assembly protein PilF
MSIRYARRLLLLLITIGIAGCGTSPRPKAAVNTVAQADAMVTEAIELMPTDAKRAAELLDGALAINPHDARAHNNRGVLHLQAGAYFDAANAFDAARRLMPSHPGPRVNLGLLFERAGRIDDAIGEYQNALEVADGHMPAVQALARCQLKHGRGDEDTVDWLRMISIQGTSESWRRWAAAEQARAHDAEDSRGLPR